MKGLDSMIRWLLQAQGTGERWLREELRPGDLVLVKASKSEKMWEVAEHLGTASAVNNENGESPK